ncbi:Zinc finger RNA-binding protein 2 [Toxocara canis]|uniref:Zinc finger RNA-binding protein 2 n=1 Tax=Toxocara canis TaxID=6265 RepID=A0A0B2VHS0_TOXCA|nr:Zinc finger RNA-binding protein 2 [Toxocara canis]
MYGFTGQSQYGSYNSTYATSPAAAVYSAVQSQQTAHTPTLGAVGATNPTSVYARSFSFSNAAAAAAAAPSGSPYAAAAAYAATPSAAAAYAQYGQTAAAVAAVQQQQQLQAATGVVSASAGYGAHGAATRLTDSYSTVGTVPSTGGTYTSLADYTNTLRTAAAAAAAANPTSNSSFVGVTRIGTTSSNPLTNTACSMTGTSTAASTYTGYDAAVYAAASSYLQSKAAGTTNVWMGTPKKGGTAVGYGSTNASYSTTASTNAASTGMGRGQTSTRGRGSFPNKRYGGQSRPAGDIQQFYCETYKEHIEGQKHKKKEAIQKGEGQTLSKSRVSFRCETCNVTCTGKDTYESHIRGSKHQKTANLMKKLGKPVPETPTVLAPGEKSNSAAPAANGTPIATVGGPAVPTKRVVGITKMNFVGGQKLQTTDGAAGAADAALEAAGQKNAAVEAALAAEKDVQPVGEDYVEEERNAAGKLVQYNCKLCDCKFSDPNAKNIHIKGRKHRLQYKLKVNPELVVDVKPNQMPREMRNELVRKMRAHGGPPMMMPRPYGPPQPLMFPHPAAAPRPWFGMMDPGRRVETSEDRHVMAKHKQIYPDDIQLNAVEKLVAMIEKALKGVSDQFAAKDTKTEGTAAAASDAKGDEKTTTPVSTPTNGGAPQRDRLLKGVMRVGLLAKGLLIKSDKEVQLVVLCSQPPSRTLLSQVAKLLPDHLEKGENDIVTVLEKADESALLVKQSDNDMICRIVLSAVTLREDTNNSESGAKQTSDKQLPVIKDPLPKGPCLDALAELRHAKWFQARCANLQSAGITLRIFREIRQRVPAWQPLSTWATELFVEKVLASHGAPLSPGDAVRRVFEAIASGVLFSTGPGLKDPCEKDGRDVLADLSGQQREDITAGSQHALRLIAFNQMYKVLNVERLPDPRSGPVGPPVSLASLGMSGDRKRPRDANGSPDDGEVVDVKKDKKEEAKGGEKSTA